MSDSIFQRAARWLRTRRRAFFNRNGVLKLRKHYAALAARQYEDDFDRVDTYCMFIGYPRSGHSLIGGLLDAHPHMIIAYELNALKYVQKGFDERALYYMLLQKSRAFARQGAKSAGYSYYVPGQYNGAYMPPLRVIGDKKGGATAEILSRNPEALNFLRQTIASPVKLIHVVRHPLDNISTISRKHGMTLMDATDYYFNLCEAIKRVKAETEEGQWFEMHLEAFVRGPEEHLRRLCAFLGQEAPSTYIKSCSKLVFDSPHKSRHKVEWSDDVKNQIRKKISNVSYLDKYNK